MIAAALRLSMSADRDALGRMQRDADIASEAVSLVAAMHGLAVGAVPSGGVDEAPTAQGFSSVRTPLRHVRLNWLSGQGGHQPSPETVSLLREVGGRPAIARFVDAFYALAFNDPHLDRFIRDRSDPHGDRFADWITEKFGDGTPWSTERAGTFVCARTHAHTHARTRTKGTSTVCVARACLHPGTERMRGYQPHHKTPVPLRAPALAHRRRDPLKHVEQCCAGRRTCPFQSHGQIFQTPHDR